MKKNRRARSILNRSKNNGPRLNLVNMFKCFIEKFEPELKLELKDKTIDDLFLKIYSEKIETYALSLVKHGECECLEEALVESTRWHLMKMKGLEEPLKCPYSPDIEISVEFTEHDNVDSLIYFIETHSLSKNNPLK